MRNAVIDFTRGVMDRVRELAGITEPAPAWIERDGDFHFDGGWGVSARLRPHILLNYGKKQVFIVYGRRGSGKNEAEAYLCVEESLESAKRTGEDFIRARLRGIELKDLKDT